MWESISKVEAVSVVCAMTRPVTQASSRTGQGSLLHDGIHAENQALSPNYIFAMELVPDAQRMKEWNGKLKENGSLKGTCGLYSAA